MKNSNLFRFCGVILSVILIFLSCLQANAQQYDTLLSLKGFHRYELLTNFISKIILQPEEDKAASKLSEIKKLSEWVAQHGDKLDKEVFDISRDLCEMEVKKIDIKKQVATAEKYLEMARISKNSFLLFSLYYFISTRTKTTNLYNKSIESSLYSLDELKNDPEGAYYKQTWALYVMAMDFYNFKDYKKAQELSTASFKYYKTPFPEGDWFVKICSNLVGMAYLKDEKFDSARKWLDITLKVSQAAKDSGWIGIATGNLASVYYLQKKYAEAIPLFEKAIPLCCHSNNVWDNVSPFSSRLAFCYMQTGNKAAVPAALALAESANKKDTTLTFSNALEYYTIATGWQRSLGNTEMALEYSDSASKYQSVVDDEFNVLKKVEAEANLAYRNHELESNLLKQEEKKERLIRYGLTGAFVLMGCIGMLLYKRQNLSHQLKKEKLEHEKRIAKEELYYAIVEIKEFTQNVWEKNKLIEQFAEQVNNLKLQNKTITDTQVGFMEDLKQSAILTEEDWLRFKQIFEKAHPGFLNRLKTKSPDLTPAETRYILFCKLGMLPKEMMSILGVSAESIRNVRFRIKKKLQLDDAYEMEDYLKTI